MNNKAHYRAQVVFKVAMKTREDAQDLCLIRRQLETLGDDDRRDRNQNPEGRRHWLSRVGAGRSR